MNTGTAIRTIAAAAAGRPVVFAAGDLGTAARRVADRPNHFYVEGTNGLASSIGIGVALHARQTTIVVDDAESLLANLAGLTTAGMLTDLPLVHVVLDGTPAAASGGGALPGGRTDLCGLAMAVGYRRMYTVDVTENLGELVRKEVADCPSPVFVRCLLGDGAIAARARRRRARRGPFAPYRAPDPAPWSRDAA